MSDSKMGSSPCPVLEMMSLTNYSSSSMTPWISMLAFLQNCLELVRHIPRSFACQLHCTVPEAFHCLSQVWHSLWFRRPACFLCLRLSREQTQGYWSFLSVHFTGHEYYCATLIQVTHDEPRTQALSRSL